MWKVLKALANLIQILEISLHLVERYNAKIYSDAIYVKKDGVQWDCIVTYPVLVFKRALKNVLRCVFC